MEDESEDEVTLGEVGTLAMTMVTVTVRIMKLVTSDTLAGLWNAIGKASTGGLTLVQGRSAQETGTRTHGFTRVHSSPQVSA